MIDTNLPISRLQNNLLLIYFEKTFSLTTTKPFSTTRTKNGTIKLSKFCKNQTRNSLTLKTKSDFFPDLCKLHLPCSRQKVYFSKLCSKKYTDHYYKEDFGCWTVLTPAVDSHEAPVVKPFLGVIVMARWQHLILCPGWWHQKNAYVTTAPVNKTDGEYHVFEFVYLSNSPRAWFGGYRQFESASWWDVSVQRKKKHTWYHSVSLMKNRRFVAGHLRIATV